MGNAVSALGKILISEPASLPTKEVMPAFLSALPLTGDFSENKYVYEVVMRFIMEQPSYIQSNIVEALTSLGMALSEKEVDDETKSKIVMFEEDLFGLEHSADCSEQIASGCKGEHYEGCQSVMDIGGG